MSFTVDRRDVSVLEFDAAPCRVAIRRNKESSK